MTNDFTLEGVISIFLSLIGIGVTIFIFYSEISKRINLLIHDKKGELTREQAKDFSTIYIDYIVEVVHRKIDQLFIENIFSQTSLDVDISNKYDEVARSIFHIRGQISEFYLINGKTYKAFIEESSYLFNQKVKDGQKRLDQLILDSITDNEPDISDYGNLGGTLKIRTEAHKIVEVTGVFVKDIIKQEIYKIYGNKKQ